MDYKRGSTLGVVELFASSTPRLYYRHP